MVTRLTTLDGSLTLESGRYGETYRSRRGALTEARHVFLASSGVSARLAAREAVRVLEVGFGTGLNFLVTAAAAEEHGGWLEYVGIERDPLPAAVLAELGYGELLQPHDGPSALLSWLAALGARAPQGTHVMDHGPTRLELRIGEAAVHVATLPSGSFDAVYLDPFSPRVNPDAWSAQLLAGLAKLLRPAGRLVTYSVSGEVRRALAAAGLQVRKVPGPPGGKRESLIAVAPER